MILIAVQLLLILCARFNAAFFPDDGDDSCHIQAKIIKDLVSKCSERSISGTDFSAPTLGLMSKAVREIIGDEIQKLKTELKKEINDGVSTISKRIDEFTSEMHRLADAATEVRSEQIRFAREVSSKFSTNLEATRADLDGLKTASVQNSGKESPHCPSDTSFLTVLANGKKYYFSNESRVTWYEARVHCEMQKLHLASPKTEQELNSVHSEARTFNLVPWWLSASDAKHDPGHFLWHDGTFLSSSSSLWSEGEPSNYGQGNEACAWIRSNAPAKLWGSKCSSYFHYICELPAACSK